MSTLLDAILKANEALARGDPSVRAEVPGGALPFVITCMDPRLVGKLIPAMGLAETPPPQAKFAGGIVQPGDVSGVRSVLAAAIFNMATEVLVVGHTDCRMGKTSSTEIRNGLARLGVRTEAFQGQDPVAWLGAFASERASVQSSVEALRAARRMPASLPIHGLLYHLDSRRLEVVVRGYDAARADAAVGAGSAPGVDTGYRPGPASLDAPPPPTFGAAGLSAPTMPATPGPVSFEPGPVTSFGQASFPEPPSFAAPPPPPPAPEPPPPPKEPPPPVEVEAERDDEPPEEPPPPPRRRPPKSAKRPPRRSDSPFDRANEVLERLRRERE